MEIFEHYDYRLFFKPAKHNEYQLVHGGCAAMTKWRMNGFTCEFCECVFMVDVDEGIEVTCPKCQNKDTRCMGSTEVELPE